jgi:hypothetical protein
MAMTVTETGDHCQSIGFGAHSWRKKDFVRFVWSWRISGGIEVKVQKLKNSPEVVAENGLNSDRRDGHGIDLMILV